MSNGVPTTLLPIRPMLDDLLGNHEDSTVRVPFETFVGLVTAALRAPIRKKWLFAADLQPNGPTQVASARQVLDDWALRHSDAAAIYLLGDLVHEASEGGTGAAPAYGIPELLEDWALRGLPEMKPLSGNGHDRDGSYQLSSGGTRHEKAWTYRTYREHLGEQHYLIVDGNMAVVMLGDMAGSTFGEITRPALEWFRDTLMELQGKNVIIATHEPVEGAWNPTGSPAKTAFHRYSAELVAIASQHDNICAWFYGHVGFDYALSTEIREFAGTLHIGVQMGLERGGRIENGGEFDWPFHYAVIEAQTGESGLSFRREDAKTGAVIPGTQMTIPTKYPVHFHAGSSFDGRFAAQRTRPILRGPVTITMDASDRRVLGSGGQYYAPSGETPMLILAPTEIAVDDLTTGHGWSVDFYVAGSVSKYLSTADGVTEVPTGPSEGDLELTFASLSEFPAVGDPDTWYLAQNTGLSYRWVSGAYTLVQAGRYVTAEPGLGWGGRIVPVKASAADNNFSADMLFYASGSGETDASKVLFGIGRSTGVFEAPNGLTVAGRDVAASVNVNPAGLAAPRVLIPTSAICPQVFGGMDNATNNTARINAALSYLHSLGGGRLRIPYRDGGVYEVNDALLMGGNVSIECDEGVRIKRVGTVGFLRNSLGVTGATVGFTGRGNITIEGGIWDGNGRAVYQTFNAFAFGHGAKVNLFNVEVLDVVRAHAVDISAMRDLTIDTCRFFGFAHSQTSPDGYGTTTDTLGADRTFSEAVQLDHNRTGSFSFGALDGTQNTRITVRNSVFGPNPYVTPDATFASYGSGVGAHGGIHDLFATDLRILGNSFEGCGFAGVRLWKWSSAVVEGNRFNGCARGVHDTAVSFNLQSANDVSGTPSGVGQSGRTLTIESNRFEGGSDIDIFFNAPDLNVGETPHYRTGVTLAGNTFKGGNIGIVARWLSGAAATGNTFYDMFRAYEIGPVSGMSITGGAAVNIAREVVWQSEGGIAAGLRNLGYSNNMKIHGVVGQNIGYSGVNLSGAVKGFSISDCDLTGVSQAEPTRHGILVSANCTRGFITGNRISRGSCPGAHVNGINVTASCSDINISNNVLYDHSGAGIVTLATGVSGIVP